MEELNITLTDIGRLARHNDYRVAGHGVSEFIRALAEHFTVNVTYSDGRVLVFRDGEYVKTIHAQEA